MMLIQQICYDIAFFIIYLGAEIALLIAIPFETLEDVNSVCQKSGEIHLNFCSDKGDHVLANTTQTGLYGGKLFGIGFIFLQLDLIMSSQAHEMYHTQVLELWGSRRT